MLVVARKSGIIRVERLAAKAHGAHKKVHLTILLASVAQRPKQTTKFNAIRLWPRARKKNS